MGKLYWKEGSKDMLEDYKQKIIQVNNDIDKAKSIQRKRQLLKHKHRLEKEVMTYMYLRYGVEMRKDKSR